jgi:hypothetical protein
MDRYDLCEEFKRQAQECRLTAASVRDRNAKTAWLRMADRWSAAADRQAETDRQAAALRLSKLNKARTQKAAYAAARTVVLT